MDSLQAVCGCLLGGALGDALGAPVEFLSLDQIRSRHGPSGIQDLDEAYGVLGAITDDTQMTLFSAEGMIRSRVRWLGKENCHAPTVIAGSYQRWLHTQGGRCDPSAVSDGVRGWLLDVEGLYHNRAPGVTCIAALSDWTTRPAVNNSKGCGAVMRSAPMAMISDAFTLAVECAAITHGHPEGQLSSGIFAQAVRCVIQGSSIEEALLVALTHDDTGSLSSHLVERALALHRSGAPTESAIAELGEGWVAEEALGIGAFCALRAEGDFKSGVRMAVNHGGDSDSTGSICGNLLGASVGKDCLPCEWLEQLELKEVITQVAEDLSNIFFGSAELEAVICHRYAGT